jgi:hypothetical protein
MSVAWIVTSLAVGGTAGVGVVAWQTPRTQAPPVATHEHLPPPAVATARPAADSIEREPAEPLVAPQPILPAPNKVGPAASPAGTPAIVASRATLDAEVSLLRDARDALRDRRPRQALEILDEHARRFPSGVLAEERRAVHAIARCTAMPGADSRAEAESFLRSAPDSPLIDRVRSTCFDTPEGWNR